MSSYPEPIRIKKVLDYPKLAFIVMLLVFCAYGVFIARTLASGIIPDEPAHFLFSKYYSTTLGIPPDTIETAATGWYIKHNPFLYHWINGRVINIAQWVYPTANDWQLLVILRLVSLSFTLGSVILCYLISKELIKNKWFQLLPSFMLTNTLMFVFLAGGANYDNLAVLCSMASLYYLLRVFTGNYFLTNSLTWMIWICLGTLVKYPILPLALGMFIAWLIFTLKNRKLILPFPRPGWRHLSMIVGLLLLIGVNFAIYGYNLIAFKWILPNCQDLLPTAQCELSPFVGRYQAYALDHKLSVVESIDLGYPDPLEYTIYHWLPKMFDRIFGILGHKVYYPNYITYFQLLFAWVTLLAVRYWKRLPFSIICATAITIAYAVVLINLNYDSELTFGFKNIALQGRYIFPVLGLVYGLYGYTIEVVVKRPLRIITVLGTLILFLAFGPIRFLLDYHTVFSTWFNH